MRGFGAGPGAPGQTRDVSAGGYPSSGGASKGQIAPNQMGQPVQGPRSSAPMATGIGTGGTPQVMRDNTQFASELTQASEANPQALANVQSQTTNQGSWLSGQDVTNLGSGMGPQPVTGTLQTNLPPVGGGGTDTDTGTGTGTGTDTDTGADVNPNLPPVGQDDEGEVFEPVDGWVPATFQQRMQDSQQVQVDENQIGVPLADLPVSPGGLSPNYWDNVPMGSISSLKAAQAMGDGTDTATYGSVLNAPRYRVSFNGGPGAVVAQYGGVPLNQFQWGSSGQAETWEQWQSSLDDDMQRRNDPTIQGSLPWYLQNPWNAWVPQKYLDVFTPQFPNDHYGAIVAAQQAAYNSGGDNTLPPPSAWQNRPLAAPRYMTFFRGSYLNPTSYHRVDQNGLIQQIDQAQYAATAGQPGFGMSQSFGPGVSYRYGGIEGVDPNWNVRLMRSGNTLRRVGGQVGG